MRKQSNLRLGLEVVLLAFMLGYLVAACGGGLLGGPHSSPESVARAYVEAIASGDCQKAESYISPDLRDTFSIQCYCGADPLARTTSARIDEVVVRQQAWVTIVTLLGEFVRMVRMEWQTTPNEQILTELYVHVEELSGKWYVSRPLYADIICP